ncbi:MAG: hypothetical protein MZV70_73735, partial [Desulfobacterales bacterium]|nr:hypothetical protein [Desulfobacterales bacterium]
AKVNLVTGTQDSAPSQYDSLDVLIVFDIFKLLDGFIRINEQVPLTSTRAMESLLKTELFILAEHIYQTKRQNNIVVVLLNNSCKVK